MKRLLLLVFLGVALPSVRADRPDEDRRDRGARVILYQHADFRGDFLVLYPGEAIENFSGRAFDGGNSLNDSVSSIRIEGGAEVTLYENGRFRGRALHLQQSVRDLSGRLLGDNPRDSWNDRASSIKVDELRRRPPPRPREIEALITRAYLDLIGREPDDRALRNYRRLMIEEDWSERRVRDDLRHGEEFRREGAERMVRRAFLEVLGREVDPGTLKMYRRTLLERDWTDDDLRDDLRRSDEYKIKHGGR